MTGIASFAQLRMSFLRWALVIVPLVMLLGFLSGQISGSGEGNGWYQAMEKPSFLPPGAVFGIVWSLLYLLMGLALSLVLHARGAALRTAAVLLFSVQFALNLFWSPLFFGLHQVFAAFWLIVLIFLFAAATTYAFARVRKAAAWLMLPYLGWLLFAGLLNYEFHLLNPDAASISPVASTAI